MGGVMNSTKEYLALAGMVGSGLQWGNKRRLDLPPIKKKAPRWKKAKRKMVQMSRRRNRS
jgi:hypothetical protein